MAQKVREVMTEAPVTVGPGTDLITVARTMRDQAIGDVLVAEGDQLHGIVTDRDLVVRGIADGGNPGQIKVAEVCSADMVTVSPEDDCDRAVKLMRERSIRRLPVVQNGHAVGVVSLGDLAIERDERSALADISAAEPNL
jgi:signal-transduction protein with cAMP-binding, CBS, and nucleotidyltransferase domain